MRGLKRFMQKKLLEAERLKTRTTYDIEMMKEMGYCSGIENYSAPISGRKSGEPPATLLHYFPDDFLCMIDEAHVSVPQIGAMYEGDRSRKQNLVNFGFRLPSALDNRPLKFEEFSKKLNQVIYVTATPRKEEIKQSSQVVEITHQTDRAFRPDCRDSTKRRSNGRHLQRNQGKNRAERAFASSHFNKKNGRRFNGLSHWP